MKTYNQEMTVYCDNSESLDEEEFINCHVKLSVTFPKGMGIRDFYAEIRGQGWYISKKADFCPYCKKKYKLR